MTDEELKPFIGKKVLASIKYYADGSNKWFDGELSVAADTLHNKYYAIRSKNLKPDDQIQCFLAGAFVGIRLFEPEKIIPKGFIAITAVNNDGSKVRAFLKADKIVSVEEYPQKYDVKTKIEFWDSTAVYTTEPIDETIAKIAEALND